MLYKTTSGHQFARVHTPIKEDFRGIERPGSDATTNLRSLLVNPQVDPATPVMPCRTRNRRSVSTGLLRRRGQGPLQINSTQKPATAVSIELYSQGNFFPQESLNGRLTNIIQN